MNVTKLLDFWKTIDILNCLSEPVKIYVLAFIVVSYLACQFVYSVTKSGIEDEGVAIIANGIMKHPDCALRRFWYVMIQILTQ